MTDPSDSELLEFVARFAGTWPNATQRAGWSPLEDSQLPDYLHSVDAFIRDVWPTVRQSKCLADGQSLQSRWHEEMILGYTRHESTIANADARSRCLALWRALEGRLP